MILDENLFEDFQLDEADTLAKPFKKELKNRYKSFDRQRDAIKKYNADKMKEIQDKVPQEYRGAIADTILKKEPKFYNNSQHSSDVERKEFPFYVTHYEETPYYHPEEGGYYVAGVQAAASEGFDNKEDALKTAAEWADHLDMEKLSDTFYTLGSKYIGENEYIAVETAKDYLSREKGDQQYESLIEDIDDVVVIDVPDVIADIKEDELTPSGPAVGEDTGIADLLLNLINGENDTIREYNTFKANLGSHPEFASVIDDIANEENNHVGMLQTLLKQISPNVETIKQGEEEAENDLFDDDNNLMFDEIVGEIDDDVENNAFLSKYLGESIQQEDYSPYQDWDEDDIAAHKAIDWKARNWADYKTDDSIEAEVNAYGFDTPVKKTVKMNKFLRANPIYPPYYKAEEEPFTGVIGPMYDGNKHGKYDIHDRYETQDLYDILSM